MRKSTNTGKQMICVLENSQEETDMSEVYGLIRKLGATSKYKGYYFVAEAVRMAQKIQERPVKITKDIYPIVARKYKSTPSNV